MSNKPTIVILATGGTIAGAAQSGTEAGYTSGRVGVDSLIAAVPQLEQLADIRGQQVANIGSQDMTNAIWLDLAGRINELQCDPGVAGIVITHGTDTIEETAYFLNLTVVGNKPVVMTAAMRPATALSADGPLNVFNAVAVAANEQARGRGVLVVINDDIHGARALTKTSTTDVQTFMSADRGLIGVIHYGKSTFYREPYRRFGEGSEFSIANLHELPRVDVLYITAGFSADLIEHIAGLGARGIVIAGVGNGNMGAAALRAVATVTGMGVVVVRASRVASGSVERNIEIDDDALGTVASGELNPAKARILLQLALLKTHDPEEIQLLFEQY